MSCLFGLDLEDCKPSFSPCMTLWLLMIVMHHNTKFGYKRFSSSENIQTFIKILNLRCDPDLEQSNLLTDSLAYNHAPSM